MSSPAVDIPLALGPLEIGILLATALYGVASMQAYTYARNCGKDPLVFRLGVLAVWVGETFLTLLNFLYLYFLTITNYGQPATVADMPWSACASYWVIGIVSVYVECFYAWRVLTLSNSLVLPLLSWAGSLVHLGANTAIFALSLREKTIVAFEARFDWTITLSLSVESAVDVLNTAALCYYLHGFRQTGHQRTVTIIDQLLSWTVETGLVISIWAMLMLILNRTTPSTNTVWSGMLMIYPKLFSNSLFLSLNSRHVLRAESSGGVLTSSGFSERTTRTRTPGLVVSVSQTTQQDVELGAMAAKQRHSFSDLDAPPEEPEGEAGVLPRGSYFAQ